MDRANPIYIPRNHIVEEVLTAASWGDHDALDQLLSVVTRPFDERPGLDRYARPRPPTSRRLPHLLRHLICAPTVLDPICAPGVPETGTGRAQIESQRRPTRLCADSGGAAHRKCNANGVG